MQALTKLIDADGYAHIYRGKDVIATFPNPDDADLFLQAESLITAADLSIRAGLDLLKERNSLAAEHGELRTVYLRACEELSAMKAALVEEGGEVPIGPAISLIENLKAERDAMAAYAGELVSGGQALFAELQQWALTEQHDETDAAFDAWLQAKSIDPKTSLARRDARIAAETLETAKAACLQIEKGQERLAWMHTTTLDDGEKVIDEHGIPYSNKALGAQHCADEIDRMARKKRREADGQS